MLYGCIEAIHIVVFDILGTIFKVLLWLCVFPLRVCSVLLWVFSPEYSAPPHTLVIPRGLQLGAQP